MARLPSPNSGAYPLLDVTGKASEGEWLTIVQHPNGERKQVCVRENQLLKREGDVLWYSTDTMPGSSGSRVFNNDWFVVALHHRGVGRRRRRQNEGRRRRQYQVDRQRRHPRQPHRSDAQAGTPPTTGFSSPSFRRHQPRRASLGARAQCSRLRHRRRRDDQLAGLASRSISRLQVSADGQVRMLPAGQRRGTESATVDAAQPEKTVQTASFDPPFDNDYEKRKGFDPDFLGGGAKRVGFPKLGRALEAVAAPLVDESNGKKYILHYHNYSVVIHKTRRLAIYSAANVSFGGQF